MTLWMLVVIVFTPYGAHQQVKAINLTQEQCNYAVQKYRIKNIPSYCTPQNPRFSPKH